MARLISLAAEDFCLFESLQIELANQGLVFIGGEDHDTDAADSNGSGKSTIFKALSWGLYGRSIDGEQGDKVIHHGAKCARVEIVIEDDEDSYKVVRERRKQSPKLFIYKNDSDKKLEGSKSDLQELIDRLIGMDWDGFRNTVLYGQNDTKRFVHPDTKDSERKDILHRIIKSGVFSVCHAEALKRNRELKASDIRLKDLIETLTDQIEGVDFDKLQERVDSFAGDIRKRVKKLALEALDLAGKAKVAKDGPSAKSIQGLINTTKDELLLLSRSIEDAESYEDKMDTVRVDGFKECSRLGSQIETIDESLEALEGEKCPTCTGPLTKGHGAKFKAGLQADRVKADKSHKKAVKQQQGADRDLSTAKETLTSLRNERDRLKGLQSRRSVQLSEAKAAQDKADDLTRQAKQKRDDAKAAKAQENPHQVTLDEARGKVKKLKQRRKASKQELKDVSLKRSAVEFWSRGYGPSGLPSFVLDATMPYLTERANHYLETLSDGDITVNFSTQRELKSQAGDFRDEIAITWVIEGVADYPPSGGQFKKLEIATDLAMMDLVGTRETSHVSLLCLDECLDGLDAQGRLRIIKLLHELRSSRETIFVISHDQHLGEIFEKSLLVVKEDGVSSLKEAA